MKVEYESFQTRNSRSKYVGQRFHSLFNGKVLDIGCHERDLKKYLPSTVDYLGIDVGGKPDRKIDLEQTETLPFADGEFDCTVCTDVLEHLDALHRNFDEIMRVTSKYSVISLPNCWVNARKPLERGRGSFSHYGLPIEKPMDRHKWFFSLSEIVEFFEAQAKRHGMKIRELFATEKPRSPVVKALRKLRHPKQIPYLNRYAHTVWCVFEKDSSANSA